MKTVEVLKAARAKIAEPEHWTQRAKARKGGIELPRLQIGYPNADCWCAWGAIEAVNYRHRWPAIHALCEFAGKSLGEYNDTHTHAEVLALYDEAIAKLESEQP